ncbi:MSMEG_0568 family radical SAM protein [Spongiibacter nanhainus]|uniref:MSMEG_0568 family radical SAM protein n=1 Tax=Spongiibacter nanhainus TaxID=2794344 RepID=A0A7T4QYM3_9GAMM|nr:MSMEG_0568 family radical SAM protein [Spongiibacter nanhainus]QQD17214.1 MSMEG_0568 family radical SAM protein [Spongiibacter nanhainus]
MNANVPTQQLITDLQTRGLRLNGKRGDHLTRRGGAGPSDHQAVQVGDSTVMVPIYSDEAWQSPYSIGDEDSGPALHKDGIPVADITFVHTPSFYDLSTADGVPYSHIATLHSADVLATTVLQTCIRYESRRKACKFCSIGQSLRAGRTIAHKTPEQLAEVAAAAVKLDGIKHMVMTTGTPASADRGASVLCDSAKAVKAAVDIPIQGQCEPPRDPIWYQRMKDAGIDALGMHLEVVTPSLRDELMPGKSELPVPVYMQAFADAVSVFGRGQVSTYILAGLGDSHEAIVNCCKELVELGVYPFVVPFVPIRGTPLEDHPAPSSEFMDGLLRGVGALLKAGNLRSTDIKAGCGRCGACSSQSKYEV